LFFALSVRAKPSQGSLLPKLDSLAVKKKIIPFIKTLFSLKIAKA
jgi:hypothetical protein